MINGTFNHNRGGTLSLALEAVDGSIAGASCEADLKRTVNGKAPGDAAPVVAEFDVVESADVGTGKPGWVLTIIDTDVIAPGSYVADARISLADGFTKQTDTVRIEIAERVTVQ